jgi:hypothetical protein
MAAGKRCTPHRHHHPSPLRPSRSPHPDIATAPAATLPPPIVGRGRHSIRAAHRHITTTAAAKDSIAAIAVTAAAISAIGAIAATAAQQPPRPPVAAAAVAVTAPRHRDRIQPTRPATTAATTPAATHRGHRGRHSHRRGHRRITTAATPPRPAPTMRPGSPSLAAGAGPRAPLPLAGDLRESSDTPWHRQRFSSILTDRQSY